MGEHQGGGRPKGSRNKLGEAFIDDVYTDWQKSGAEAIVKCRENDPAQYCRLVASLIPKELHIRDVTFDHLTDEQLADTIELVERYADLLRSVDPDNLPIEGSEDQMIVDSKKLN